jgi:2-dehydropantoate 2-reductase
MIEGQEGVSALRTRVCVVGCGAIGGLFAAHLAQLPELEVWVYDTSSEAVAAIEAGGVRVSGARTLTGRVQARADPREIPGCQFGIVATKGTVTEAAIAATAAVLADAAVVSVQNGIGNEEVIARHVPRVIRGVTLPAVAPDGPGAVHLTGGGQTWIGPFEPRPATSSEIDRLATWLTRSGLETLAMADARGAQWTKLLFNAATNPICAVTGLTHGQMCDHTPSRELSGRLLDEGLAVAAALKVSLTEDPVEMVDRLGQANYLHRPSMLQDVRRRRATEIDTLNGGIVAAGRDVGVPTPVNAAITSLVHGVEHSWGLDATRPTEIQNPRGPAAGHP